MLRDDPLMAGAVYPGASDGQTVGTAGATEEGGCRGMWPVLATAAVAFGGGVVVALVVLRWPQAPLAAPRLEASTIVGEVRRHRTVASLLRARLDPQTTTGLILTVAALVVIGGAAAVGVLLVMVRRDVGFARWDLGAARWGATHATEVATTVLRDVSVLGGTFGLVTLGVVVAVLEHRRIPNRSALVFVVAVFVGQNLLANGTKLVIERARPDIRQLTGFAGSSFPSGHATAAAACYAAAALLLSRRRSLTARALLAGGAVAIAVGVAASRVLLGVHWLTDVLAGLALGWAWFALCSIAVGGRLMIFAAPVEIAEHEAEEVAASG
jgi:undecaprenyl-diphosphatase